MPNKMSLKICEARLWYQFFFKKMWNWNKSLLQSLTSNKWVMEYSKNMKQTTKVSKSYSEAFCIWGWRLYLAVKTGDSWWPTPQCPVCRWITLIFHIIYIQIEYTILLSWTEPLSRYAWDYSPIIFVHYYFLKKLFLVHLVILFT